MLEDDNLTVKEAMDAILDINMRSSTFPPKERQIDFNLKGEGVKGEMHRKQNQMLTE